MSRHSKIDSLACCDSAKPSTIDWGGFVDPPDGGKVNAIDAFYVRQMGLTAISSWLRGNALREELKPILADQLLMGYVSATEAYFRRIIGDLARLCPDVRASVADMQISFQALDYYSRESIENALTERMTFTEKGKIKSLLESRMLVKVQAGSSLEAAVKQFEELCQIRHAVVHSAGLMASHNASTILPIARGAQSQVVLGSAELDLAAGICVNLIREVNEAIAREALWRAVRDRRLLGNRNRDRSYVKKFESCFVSTLDRENGVCLSSAEAIHQIVKTVSADVVVV